MTKFGISEYIRNFWFNLCSILLLIVMMILTTGMISNIDEKAGMYKIARKYMDYDSMYLASIENKNIEELKEIGDVNYVQTIEGDYGPRKLIRGCVYTREIMKNMKPKLEYGTYPDKVTVDSNTVKALISANPYGIKAGDTFTYIVSTLGESVPVNVYVTGVIKEGQRLYITLNKIFINMSYEDFFPVYSYEQTEDVRLIIPESEISKMPEAMKASLCDNVMINPKGTLTQEERDAIYDRIADYDITGSSPYPEPAELVNRNNTMFKMELMKYIPLSVVTIVLLCISIIGIVNIKTAKSTRYYGIMYAYGMRYKKAQVIEGVSMTFNCGLAVIFTVSLIKLQQKMEFLGEINCNLNMPQIITITGICIIIIFCSMFAAKGVLKEHTPVQILKNKN
ncbi:MAG: hypothetical protein MR953_01515 [Butyrivibrio crossotus]|nr:hypothetical protein [Butyrivibrio crossotus]